METLGKKILFSLPTKNAPNGVVTWVYILSHIQGAALLFSPQGASVTLLPQEAECRKIIE